MPLYNPTSPAMGVNRVLWTLIGADMTLTTDQALAKAFGFTNYIIDRIIVNNASLSLAAAVGGIYTAASKGGTAVVGSGQVYSALTGATPTLALTLADTSLRTGASLILSLTVPQLLAATADFRVIGWALT